MQVYTRLIGTIVYISENMENMETYIYIGMLSTSINRSKIGLKNYRSIE